MPFPSASPNLQSSRLVLREGFLKIGPFNSTNPLNPTTQFVGGTNGGVAVTLNIDYAPIEVDQLHSPAELYPTSIAATIETSLTELGLYHLALAFGLPKDAIAGSSVLTISFNKLSKFGRYNACEIETVRPPTTDTEFGTAAPKRRDFTFPKVKVTSAGAYTTSRTDPTFLPIVVNVLGWRETSGEYDEILGQITDEDAQWSDPNFD